MATLRDIRRRIIGVKSTQQITKAMKMVAAARLRRAQENIINARPYSRKIQQVLQHLLLVQNNLDHPLFKEREVKNVAIVVITSDRGLCGSFNMNITREASELIERDYSKYLESGNLSLYCIGKKGLDFFNLKNYPIEGKYPGIFSNLNFQVASGIIQDLVKKFINQEVDKVVVIYNEFKSVIQQRIVVEQLLPIPKGTENTVSVGKSADYIYEPDVTTIIGSLLPRHLNSQMWRILLESYAAELGARMTAMDMATENAKELISALQLKYNRERQAAITTEILEIVSGANALAG